MKSITIHNIETPVIEQIEEQARRQGTSLNKTIKNLLKQSLSITDNAFKEKKAQFMDLFGAWSKKDEKDFQKKTKVFEKVDKGDWL